MAKSRRFPSWYAGCGTLSSRARDEFRSSRAGVLFTASTVGHCLPSPSPANRGAVEKPQNSKCKMPREVSLSLNFAFGNSLIGLPGATRTRDPQLRRLLLYPAELRAGKEGQCRIQNAKRRMFGHPFFCIFAFLHFCILNSAFDSGVGGGIRTHDLRIHNPTF
jgi:hypothetical protein